MRIWPRRRSTRTLTALVAGSLLATSAGTAHADLIVNGVDDSIDTTLEVMPLAMSTGVGTTTVYVVGADGDGDPGCNFDGAGETVTVDIASSDEDVATVSPSTVVLSACGSAGAQTLTVTPTGVGSASVTTTVAARSNKTGGTFSVANARFTTRVTKVPNTPPELDIVGVEEGGQYAKGSLQRPDCVATDPDDVPEAPHTKTWPAPLTAISGPYATDAIGTRYAMCSYVDEGGVQVLARKGFSIVDESAPGIARTIDPVADGTGWFQRDVTVTHTVTEAQSGSSLSTTDDCDPVTLTEDTRLRTLTCTATSAGGTRTVTTHLRRDATAPEVSPTSTISGGGAVVDGWHTSPVDVAFTATDETSLFLVDGRAVGASSQTVTSRGDGELVLESPAFTDRAGNASAVGAATRTVKVDATAPNAPIATPSTPADDEGWHTGPVTVTFEAAGDEGSGVASCTAPEEVDVDTDGTTVSGTCTDRVGHTSAATQVTVKLDRGEPVVTQAVAAEPTGTGGWHTSDVAVEFTATDAISGLESATRRATSTGEGAAVGVASPAFVDRAGNTTAAGALTETVKVDKTAPAVPTFTGGLAGYFYAWGETPAAPTCTSSDATSGLASCTVEGDGASVGLHTYTATATDQAGNTSTATRRYVVAPWITKGFTSPIDMRKTNTVKGGSTVPAKFEVFAGRKEITDPAKVTMSSRAVACSTGKALAGTQPVTSGSTALRYDTRAGQFVHTWKTPTGKGSCYALTMATPDGSSVTARFALK